MNEEEIIKRLSEILIVLTRMESRQVSIKEDIKEQEQPVQGSFASTDQ
jgi:hypothetical protein